MIAKTLIFLMVAIAVASALFACPKDYCSRVNCENLSECLESNGMRVREKGGFCQCCDICVKVLGEGQRCQPEGQFLGVIITSECAKGLTCDFMTRRCVKEE